VAAMSVNYHNQLYRQKQAECYTNTLSTSKNLGNQSSFIFNSCSNTFHGIRIYTRNKV